MYEENLFAIPVKQYNEIVSIKNIFPAFSNLERNFLDLAKHLEFPMTLLVEKKYVDKEFRDSFYNYFSSKFNLIDRDCSRISIFYGTYKVIDFYEKDNYQKIKDSFVGIIILKPLSKAAWGRTLVDPRKMTNVSAFIRTTRFDFIINGLSLSLEAYPFSSQDGEFMTCAETSIWTVLYYYGSRYPEYRIVLPSEMLKVVDEVSEQRTLPSRGLTFLQQSIILKKFGFYPRIYSRDKLGKEKFKRFFHYYIESGIPVAMSLGGHAVVGIGHAGTKYKPCDVASNKIGGCKFVDTSDLYESYVVMDDNRHPYVVCPYDNFSLHKDCKELKYFTVPLYKRIFLECSEAKSIFERVLLVALSKIEWIKEIFMEEEKNGGGVVLKRVFLTSSRKFKQFRSQNSNTVTEHYIYSNILLPKFIWVMEFSNEKQYEENEVFGEIVIDATSDNNWDGVLLLRFQNYFGYRLETETFIRLLSEMGLYETGKNFKQYSNNLMYGGNYDNGGQI